MILVLLPRRGNTTTLRMIAGFEFPTQGTITLDGYDVEVGGQLMTGLETDPYVMELFDLGEQVSVGFAEGCIQVLHGE